MKSLLFALGLTSATFVQAEQFEDFDLSRIKRDQYITAMTSNCKKMKKMLPHMKASPVTFEQKSADEIKMTIDRNKKKRCKKITSVFKRENGVFTSQGKGCKKTMKQIEMNDISMYTSMNVTRGERQCTVASLTVTNLNDTEMAMDGFRSFADGAGLANENIHTLSRDGMCERSS
uniref:Lipocalin/cytosolic fatty-acid binding domain-containing protein n=1 Tax=Laticauda laticaudata TaxID=8630 RepID=A0A8C5RL48_LATLA